MKIRIKGNTVRYRLLKTDVEKLVQDGFLQEHTEFPGRSFHYRLEGTNDERISCDFIGDSIIVRIPHSFINEWKNTDRVTYKEKADKISILLEKDFACLDHSDEDQSNNYPNPNISCK